MSRGSSERQTIYEAGGCVWNSYNTVELSEVNQTSGTGTSDRRRATKSTTDGAGDNTSARMDAPVPMEMEPCGICKRVLYREGESDKSLEILLHKPASSHRGRSRTLISAPSGSAVQVSEGGRRVSDGGGNRWSLA